MYIKFTLNTSSPLNRDSDPGNFPFMPTRHMRLKVLSEKSKAFIRHVHNSVDKQKFSRVFLDLTLDVRYAGGYWWWVAVKSFRR